MSGWRDSNPRPLDPQSILGHAGPCRRLPSSPSWLGLPVRPMGIGPPSCELYAGISQARYCAHLPARLKLLPERKGHPTVFVVEDSNRSQLGRCCSFRLNVHIAYEATAGPRRCAFFLTEPGSPSSEVTVFGSRRPTRRRETPPSLPAEH